VSPRNGLLLGLALAALTWALFEQGRLTLKAHPEDPSLIALFFLGTILLSVVTGIVLVVAFLPALGELIGDFFFQPSATSTPSLHEQAEEALARGDAETALQIYRAALLDNRRDRVATSEIARLLCEHQREPIAGRDFLENALRRDWPPDDFAFLILRLAEIYAFHLGDLSRATELWQRTLLVYPATPHAEEAGARLAALESGES
jgi:tetratricopeptide (TPR) repeat protein